MTPVATKMNNANNANTLKSNANNAKTAKTADTPTTPPPKKVTAKEKKAQKAKEEAKAKERGRKLLLALSSGNLDDFPQLIGGGDSHSPETSLLTSLDSSVASHTTAIAWGVDTSAAVKDIAEEGRRSRSLSAHAEPYDPEEDTAGAASAASAGAAGGAAVVVQLKTANTTKKHHPHNSSTSSTSSTSSRDTREQKIIRQKLWGVLFSNVNRTIDEVYYLCEFESDNDRTQEAIELLEYWRMDFQALLEGFQRQNEFSNERTQSSGGSTTAAAAAAAAAGCKARR